MVLAHVVVQPLYLLPQTAKKDGVNAKTAEIKL